MDEELLRSIESAYGIPSIISAVAVETGVLSSNWILVSSATRYFLKQYRFTERSRIESIHNVKTYFHTQGTPVIMPLASRDGQTCVTYNGGNYSLFPYVKAQSVERGSIEDETVVSMATTLARMHLAGKEAPIIEGLPAFKAWSKESFNERASELQEVLEIIEEPSDFDVCAMRDLGEKRAFVCENTISFENLALPQDHLLHGDYSDRNLFFNAEGRVTHVFDWEKAAYGPRVYEVLRTILLSILSTNPTDVECQQARLFMNTYRDLYPIEVDEVRRGITMYRVKAMHNTWILREHYILNNYRADMFLYDEAARNALLADQGERFEQVLL